MDKIKFNVSAKTARLIGRENISDSNGAMIELVKNAYDADAANVYIQFNIVFEVIPITFSYLKTKPYFTEDEFSFICLYYEQDGDICTKKNVSEDVEEALKNLFFSKNQIFILDDGCGMDEETVRSVWMNIGTNDKEIHYLSKKNRIKTGAKGIGRFALEKLSQRTEVYSKKSFQTVYWGLDWLQFDKSELLDEIKADVGIKKESFKEIVKNILKENFKYVSHFSFQSGTFVVLNGTRENWNDRIFNRINNNLKSINPFGNVDKFSIHIENVNKPSFNFQTNDQYMNKEDYDYRITADFDGTENIHIILERNEVDLYSKQEKITISEKDFTFDLAEFWKRSAFQNTPYLREDYTKKIEFQYKALDLISNTSQEELEKIGKFSLDLYFLKSGNSEYSIIKEIKVNKRKKLLKNFSGIKLYRDNFKVRPYGDEGPMFDWLELGKRAQASPAGVSHPSGSWRVAPYQIIGNINISRLDNVHLVDMANRESLALNDTYFLFVELIQKIIAKFEYDRQYIYREYGAWLNLKEKEINRSATIIQNIVLEKEKKQGLEKDFSKSYSEYEYKEAIYESHKEKKHSLDTQRILMNFSSAGMITSTFAHEMKEVADQLIYNNNQVRYCCDYLLGQKKFEGPECFNPYLVLDQAQNTHELLSKWISLNMNGVSQNSFVKKSVDLKKFIHQIKDEWQVLMKYKHIEILLEEEKNCIIEIALIDLYLIFNNLFLNSSFFLEQKEDNEQRLIKISLKKTEDYVFILYENNGPILPKKYEKSPDMVFEAGETSKEKGTGLGLWICKEAVNRNQGEIHVLPKEKGFQIEMKFNKGE